MRKREGREGFMAFGALVALFVFLMMFPLLANLSRQGLEDVKKRAVADHLSTVLAATAEYIRDNRQTLLGTAGAATPVQVSMATLRARKHLLPAFGNRNAWGQWYGIYVLQPTAGKLEGIVLTYGGRSHNASRPQFGNITVPSTAALVGGAGGFIPTGKMAGQPPKTLQGAFGGWRVPLAGKGIPIPPPGHVGGLSSLRDDGNMDQDFLYRVAVPGHPELNAMQTKLDMTDHAIRRVREIHFQPHTLSNIDATGFCNSPSKNGRIFYDPNEGLYICKSGKPEAFNHTGNSLRVVGANVVSNGAIVDKPKCPSGTGSNPLIYTSPVIVSEGHQAKPMHAFQAWATDLGPRWRVNLRVLTADGWVNPPAAYGRVKTLVLCN